jgi:hypothetical protein
MSLPLPLRNRLAELILDALHDPGARAGLEALAEVCADPAARQGGRALPQRFPADLFESRPEGLRLRGGYRAHAEALCERARRGWALVRGLAFEDPEASLESALAVAARLFDARLYFEVHELLEPHWFRARGGEREVLQGLIQVAVGLQHLANGNPTGARLLLHDGMAKLGERRLAGLALGGFAAALRSFARRLERDQPPLDWSAVPRFPTRE